MDSTSNSTLKLSQSDSGPGIVTSDCADWNKWLESDVLKCEKVPCNELGFSPWFKLFQFLAGFWFSCLWFYSQAKSWAFAACVSVRSSPCCACLMIGCSVNPALSPVHQSHTRTGFHQRSRSSCLTSSSSFDRPPPLHPLFLLHFPPPGHCGRGLNYKGGGVSITT